MAVRTLGKAPGGVVRHGFRQLNGIYFTFEIAAGVSANNIAVTPINIPFQCTIDRVGLVTLAGVAGNVLVGIYRDNGDTPAGGARIAISNVTPIIASAKNEVPLINPIQLDPGLYWLAVNYDTTGGQTPSTNWRWGTGGTLLSYGANLGVFVIPDPCPAMGFGVAPPMYVRVMSIP